MKVLQLIDSLRPGGAEKMAINLANELATTAHSSYLCCTRMEGSLRDQIIFKVGYLHLNKKSALDLKAFTRLRKYVVKNKIKIIHAHGTSYFLGTLLKLSLPSIKLVWHDHFGNRIIHTKWNFPILYLCSYVFNGIIVVSNGLKEWNDKNLQIKKIEILPNFINYSNPDLKNEKVDINTEKFNIVCTANFKIPKNHINLLNAFNTFYNSFPNSHLILIGNKFKDDYFNKIIVFINNNHLNNNITIVQNETNVFKWLKVADLGVLSSDAEGLPMALIEYGLAKLPVICTNVGDCEKIIENDGILVAPNDSFELSSAMQIYCTNRNRMKLDAVNFNRRIIKEYSSTNSFSKYLKFYSRLKT